MYIKNSTLKESGLIVHLDKNGLSIQGTGEVPEGVVESVDHIAKSLAYTDRERDELVVYVVDVALWRALRNCRTEV